MRSVLAGIDYDRDRIIEFNEFLLIIGDRAQILSEINMIKLFDQLGQVEPGKVAISDVRTFFMVSYLTNHIFSKTQMNRTKKYFQTSLQQRLYKRIFLTRLS